MSKQAPEARAVERAPVPATEAPAAFDGAVLDVTLIVPVLSTAARVREVATRLGAELDRLGRTWECIFVFDGVRGAAWADAARLNEEAPNRIRVLSFQQPFGESVCLSAGFEKARGAVVVTSPQYVQVDPRELEPMLAALAGNADFVSPWRHPRVDPWLNRLQSSAFNWFVRRMIKMKFHDLNCYFRAFRRQVLEEVVLYGDMYRFLPVIAVRQGFRVIELKVRHQEEWGGAGFFGLGVYARRFLDIVAMLFLTRFTLKPLRFFGSLGGVIFAVGAAMLAVQLAQYVIAGTGLYQRPLFLIGLLLTMLGVQIIGFGLVGEIIIYTQARNLREYKIERIHE